MIVKSTRTAAALLVSILCVVPTHAKNVASSNEAPLALTVKPLCTDSSRCVLELTLRNNSGRPLELYEDLLPWRRYGMTVILVNTRSEAPLDEIQHVEDPDAELTTLPPGKTLTGVLDLKLRFPSLTSVLTTSDVACFWLYGARGEPHIPIPVVVGALVLHKYRSDAARQIPRDPR
jgi:hypothetical protein